MSVRELLKGLIDARPDLSMASLSKEMELNPAYLQQFIARGSPQKLPEEVRAHLAKRLGIDESALREGKINPQKLTTFAVPKKGIAAPKTSAMLASPDNLLRVLGMAEGGKDGWCPLNGDVVQYITRPDNLRGVPNAYAVFIKGESMSPRYEPGEIVHVHPGRPPQPGSYVLVQRHNPEDETQPLAVVKRLVKRSGSRVILAQLNPKKEFEVPAGEIVSMHKVVGSSEA